MKHRVIIHPPVKGVAQKAAPFGHMNAKTMAMKHYPNKWFTTYCYSDYNRPATEMIWLGRCRCGFSKFDPSSDVVKKALEVHHKKAKHVPGTQV